MHSAWLRLVTVVLAVAVVIGCDSFLLSRVVGDTDAVDQLEPPTPGGAIELVRASDSTLELRWPAARDNATSQDDLEYRVVWSNTDNIATPADALANGTTSLEWSPNVTSHTIDDLSAQTDHWVSVLVRDAAGGTAKYETNSVATAADATAPDLPNDAVSIVSTDVNRIQLSWASADDRETAAADLAYRVVYTQNDSLSDPDQIQSAIDAGDAFAPGGWITAITTYTIDGLAAYTSYTVVVEVRDERDNRSAYRSTSAVTVRDDAPAPGGSFSATAGTIGFNSVELTWRAATDDATAQGDLEYALYASASDNIDTFARAEANGELLLGWTAGRTTATRDDLADRLTDGRTVYLNVFVRDAAGNHAAYQTIEIETVPRFDLLVGIDGTGDRIVTNTSEYGEMLSFSELQEVALFGDDAGDAIVFDVDDHGAPDLIRARGRKGTAYRTVDDWSSGPAFAIDREVWGLDYAYTTIAVGDLNGDDVPDTAIGGSADGMLLAQDAMTGVFSELAQSDADFTNAANGIADIVVGDLNGDDLDDVVLIRGEYNAGAAVDTHLPNISAINAGGGAFRTGVTTGDDGALTGYALGDNVSSAAVLGTFTVGDDVPDLFVVNAERTDAPPQSGEDILYVGNGDGTFKPHTATVGPDTSNSTAIAAGDFDGDGDLDAAIARDGGAIIIVRNDGIDEQGGGSWHTSNPATPNTDVVRLVAHDFDGDGDVDLAGVEDETNRLVVWSNDGNGTFQVADGFPIDLPGTPRYLLAAPFNP